MGPDVFAQTSREVLKLNMFHESFFWFHPIIMGSLIFFVAFLFGHMSGARNNGGARDERRVHFEDHSVKIAQVEHDKGDAHGKCGARSKCYKGKRRGRGRGKRGKGKGYKGRGKRGKGKGYKGYKGKRRGKGRGKRGKGKNKGCNPASGEDRGEDGARPKGGARSGAREHGGASDISGARPKGGARGGKRCGEVGGARDKGGARGRNGQDKDCAHVRQGDGESHSGYRGKCDTPFFNSLKSLLNSRSIAVDKSLLDLMITVEMGSIGHRMNSEEQSKAVNEAIYEALHDCIEGQAPTNLFMAAEKNVKTFLKKYRKSLNNKTDQERGERRPSTRRVHFDMGSMDTAEACSRGAATDQSRSHLTPSTRPTRPVGTAEGRNNESPSTASSAGLGGPDSRSPEKQADRSQDQKAEVNRDRAASRPTSPTPRSVLATR